MKAMGVILLPPSDNCCTDILYNSCLNLFHMSTFLVPTYEEKQEPNILKRSKKKKNRFHSQTRSNQGLNKKQIRPKVKVIHKYDNGGASTRNCICTYVYQYLCNEESSSSTVMKICPNFLSFQFKMKLTISSLESNNLKCVFLQIVFHFIGLNAETSEMFLSECWLCYMYNLYRYFFVQHNPAMQSK